MKFLVRKRKPAPGIIIVSLIDILVVLLIFLMVTTSFKKQPAVKLALPESSQAKAGASESAPMEVIVDKKAPHLYLGDRPITYEQLQEELAKRSKADPQLTLAIRADTEAPFGQIIKVMDAAKVANVRVANAYTKAAPGR